MCRRPQGAWEGQVGDPALGEVAVTGPRPGTQQQWTPPGGPGPLASSEMDGPEQARAAATRLRRERGQGRAAGGGGRQQREAAGSAGDAGAWV